MLFRFVPDTDMFILMHISKRSCCIKPNKRTKTNIEEHLLKKRNRSEKRDDWKRGH